MNQLRSYPVLREPLSCRPGRVGLQDHLGGFKDVVCQPGHDFDVELGRLALEQLAAELDVSLCGGEVSTGAYRQLLDRLGDAMDRELRVRRDSDLSVAGGGYAAVVAAMTRIQPEMDYGTALGQLLELMGRLFSARENGWKDIYKCLRSIPDSVSAKQALTRVCLAEIREWFDAGVQNLFSLHDQLAGQVDAIREKASAIEQRLFNGERKLNAERNQFAAGGKVTSLGARLAKREIEALEQQLAEATEQLDGRRSTLDLIDSDIADFEQILRGARRAYRLQVV